MNLKQYLYYLDSGVSVFEDINIVGGNTTISKFDKGLDSIFKVAKDYEYISFNYTSPDGNNNEEIYTVKELKEAFKKDLTLSK